MYVRVGADSSPPSFGKVSNQLNSDLSGKQPSLLGGVYTGNIDNVGMSGGLPKDGSVIWFNSLTASGTVPVTAGDDVYMYLVTHVAGEGLTLQLCFPFNYSYKMSYRMYVNGNWTTWQQIG